MFFFKILAHSVRWVAGPDHDYGILSVFVFEHWMKPYLKGSTASSSTFLWKAMLQNKLEYANNIEKLVRSVINARLRSTLSTKIARNTSSVNVTNAWVTIFFTYFDGAYKKGLLFMLGSFSRLLLFQSVINVQGVIFFLLRPAMVQICNCFALSCTFLVALRYRSVSWEEMCWTKTIMTERRFGKLIHTVFLCNSAH